MEIVFLRIIDQRSVHHF